MTMFKTTRRAAIAAAFAMALPMGGAWAFDPGATECIAPANPGGGWDFTCRQVGKALSDLKVISGPMQTVNLTGGGGGVAFAEVVNKRNTDNNLIVAASSATTSRMAQGAFPGAKMDQVRWLGTVGSDYGVIAVAKDSPIQNLGQLVDQMKSDPGSVAIAGGSAVGGWDHLKVLLVAREAGIDVRQVKYVGFDGGGDAVTQMMGGHVQAFTGDISEAKGFVDSGDIRVLAVLAPERLPGEFGSFVTAKEQGFDVVGANWRGFYAPGGMSEEAYAFWAGAVKQVYDSAEWKQIMADSGLMPLSLAGADFETFVAGQIASIEELSREIGIIK